MCDSYGSDDNFIEILGKNSLMYLLSETDFRFRPDFTSIGIGEFSLSIKNRSQFVSHQKTSNMGFQNLRSVLDK
ncbi:MAG: hypothetical protein LBP35_05960 [Candidatus Ancillula trichonymphae]|nr:hypothetical protein [Candidatus Ancillula trichonymphae]